MEDIIKLKSVSKTFFTNSGGLLSFRRNRIEVLSGIDLSLGRPGITALLGPNGAGKTTIFKLISTLLLPNTGNITVNGFDTILNPIEVRKAVSIVTPEDRSFYFRLTGKQNLLFFASLCDIGKKEARKRLEEIDRLLAIGRHMDVKYQEFSTGLKQKLNLARGFLRNFSVLLLDEPVKSLDANISGEIMSYIRKTVVDRDGKTVIMTTHKMSEIENVADRFVILYKGKVAADFGREKLKGRSLEEIYKSYTS